MAEFVQEQTFRLIEDDNIRTVKLPVKRMIIAGWTARNVEAMEAHIQELEALGVKRPERTPTFYRVSASLLANTPKIEVCGLASSGEVEFFITRIDGEYWIGAGSDHTDREAETHGVALSKQMCGKPIGSELWRLSDISDHWDELQLRSYAINDGVKTLYQDGHVTAMRPVEELLSMFQAEDDLNGIEEGDYMMCGTLPAIDGVRGAEKFAFELTDPILNRCIVHEYEIIPLPVAG